MLCTDSGRMGVRLLSVAILGLAAALALDVMSMAGTAAYAAASGLPSLFRAGRKVVSAGRTG